MLFILYWLICLFYQQVKDTVIKGEKRSSAEASAPRVVRGLKKGDHVT